MVLEIVLDKSSPVPIPGSQGVGYQKQGTNTEAPKRRPKRRAADARIRKFHDLYEGTGETLGQGSFGRVHAYRNKLTNREVAVKVVEKQQRRSRYKVLKEIEIFHYCRGHENILQLIEYFEEDDRFYLVFEKMSGGSLFDVLRRLPRERRVTEEECRRVVRHLANALQFLHAKGVAHRDLKPENVLVSSSSDDTFGVVKLCDFDLASGVQVDLCPSSLGSSAGSCDDGAFVTTPELQSPVGSADFMAPEVVDVWQERAWTYDKRCDMWSLGVIMYMLLCGYKPFYANHRCSNRWCEWKDGGFCARCQDVLFEAIRLGKFDFPVEDWYNISYEAKDLVCSLLVTSPEGRLTAEQVLRHPWLNLDNYRHIPSNHAKSLTQKSHTIGGEDNDVSEMADRLGELKFDQGTEKSAGVSVIDDRNIVNSNLNNNKVCSGPRLNRCQSSPAFLPVSDFFCTKMSDTSPAIASVPDTTEADFSEQASDNVKSSDVVHSRAAVVSEPITIPGSFSLEDDDAVMTTSDLSSSLLSDEFGSWFSLVECNEVTYLCEDHGCNVPCCEGCCVVISGFEAAVVLGDGSGSFMGECFSGSDLEDYGIICWGDVEDSDGIVAGNDELYQNRG
jgi:MAP kinase interacting serine/threonine kinase